jgi:hypothetical protein
MVPRPMLSKFFGLLVLVLWWGLAPVRAQEPGRPPGRFVRKLTIKQLFAEIQACRDTVYRLTDAIIDADSSTMDPKGQYALHADSLDIKVELRFRNCKWPRKYPLVLANKKFLKPVLLTDIEDWGVIFSHCEFHGYLRWAFSTIPFFNFEDCRFYSRMDFSDNRQSAFFKRCVFDFRQYVSYFQFNAQAFVAFDSWNNGKIETLGFTECQFNSQHPQARVVGIHAKVNSLSIKNCDFGNTILDLEATQVSHTTEMYGNQFRQPVGLKAVLFAAPTTLVSWADLKGQKVALYDDYQKPFRLPAEPSQADSSFFQSHNFLNYKAMYATLLNVYKVRGDQPSYNACYVEMKDIETRKYAYDFGHKPTLRTFFAWQLNVFLRTFCDYGTDPVKSVLYAFYVIFWFSLIYFIFPSEKDNLRKEFILQKVDKYITYFSTDRKLADMHAQEKRQQLAELAELHRKLANSRQLVPPVLQLVGYPFYLAARWYYQLGYWLLTKGEISAGVWAKQPRQQRVRSAVLITLYFGGYLASGLFMRALNALILSINVFVTLGYGEIPARGVAKYLAVVEGLVGWFLLSIFSVSLIGQVLS